MKKGQFSYESGRALSHASLQKFRIQSILQTKLQPKPQINKQKFNSKPNIKYYNNTNQNRNQVATAKSIQPRKTQPNLHTTNNKNQGQQQLKRRIQVLEYQLKKKINQNGFLGKFFKCKNSAEIPQIDLYIEFSKLQEQLQNRNKKVADMQQKLQQYSQQIQSLLQSKTLHEQAHTKQITSFLSKLQKLQKKHTNQLQQKQRVIGQQRKLKEQKDLLLKQFRRKYEESQKILNNLQKDGRQNKQKRQHFQQMWRQKVQNLEQGWKIREGEWMDQVQRYQLKLRQQQQLFRQLQQKSKNKQKLKQKQLQQLQTQLSTKSQLISQQSSQLNSYKTQLQKISIEHKMNLKKIEQLTEQLSQTKQVLNQNQSKYCKTVQQLTKQLNQSKSTNRQMQIKYQKMTKQAVKLQQKLTQITGMYKSVCYDRDEKQTMIHKLKTTITQKQINQQQKDKQIQELENKIFNLQRKSTASFQHSKQLQKQILANKQQQISCTKLQIENYKCIGRLTQLTNQVNLLIGQVQIQGKIQSKNVTSNINTKNKNGNNNKKTNKNQHKQQQNDKNQTVSTCIDALTKKLQIFTKQVYKQSVQQNKSLKQLIQQIICDIKSIFHAYNSFIQDEQLKGATRQYLQCLDSNQKNIKKSRNNYLQVIMQRLISMIAIQSYTSQNGLKRNNQSKTKFSSRRHIDSLQHTCSNWQQQDQYQKQPQYQSQYPQTKINNLVENRMKALESSYDRGSIRQRQSRQKFNSKNGQSKKKISHKLITQPNQILIQNYAVRKLQYGKQNYMQRINKNQNNYSQKYKYMSTQDTTDHTNNYKRYFDDKPITIPKMKNYDNQISYKQKNKQKQKEIQKQKDIKIQRKQPTMSEFQLIQKKYFR